LCEITVPVVLYGCETWTLTSREEQRIRVFENKILRKIFWAKRVEVKGEWRKLHNAKLHALYSSPDITRNIKSRRLRWAGHVARMGESINAYRVLVGRPEGKRPLGRPRRRWEDNIIMDLREVGYDVCIVGPYHNGMARPQVADRGDGLQIWRVAVNILNKQSRTADEGWSSNLGVGRRANNPSQLVTKPSNKPHKVTGEWTKLHNTKLHAFYSLPDMIRNIKSRRSRWTGHLARMGESRNAYRVLVGRPEGKRPLGRPRRRWEDNIKMDLREMGYDRHWINLAQVKDQWWAYVRAAMNLRVP
ncbi:hypothetical protein ANN_00779, partial [Periplaneta americana]